MQNTQTGCGDPINLLPNGYQGD